MKLESNSNRASLRHSFCAHCPDFFASAAASLRNFAMVEADGSFRFPLFDRRLVFVV
jgi:hypothetical protein